MLKQINGDIFTTQRHAIGHGVNLHGVMGSGIAKTVKTLYPAVFPPYQRACHSGLLTTGGMLPVEVAKDRWILNMASQDKPGANARLDWLEDSLDAALHFVNMKNLDGLALPRIGAGIGGLEWDDVLEIIEKKSEEFPELIIEAWTFV